MVHSFTPHQWINTRGTQSWFKTTFVNPQALYLTDCVNECMHIQAIRRVKETDANRLRVEYEKLVRGLVSGGALRGGEDWLANPVLPDDIVRETVPGGHS